MIIICNGLLFPICHLAPFQVSSTKTFKQYKSNPFNDFKKPFLCSENLMSSRKDPSCNVEKGRG